MQNQELIVRALKNRIRKLNDEITALETENATLKQQLVVHASAEVKMTDASLQITALMEENTRLAEAIGELQEQLAKSKAKPPAKKTKTTE